MINITLSYHTALLIQFSDNTYKDFLLLVCIIKYHVGIKKHIAN